MGSGSSKVSIATLRRTNDSHEIESWLNSLGLSSNTLQVFRTQCLDRWEAVLGIKETDFDQVNNNANSQLSIPLGDRIIILNSIEKLRSDEDYHNSFRSDFDRKDSTEVSEQNV